MPVIYLSIANVAMLTFLVVLYCRQDSLQERIEELEGWWVVKPPVDDPR
jgi:hypothetical protein